MVLRNVSKPSKRRNPKMKLRTCSLLWTMTVELIAMLEKTFAWCAKRRVLKCLADVVKELRKFAELAVC